MRLFAAFLLLVNASICRAADDWRAVLAGMPLREPVTELNTSNYARLLLGAFESNDTVKALIIMPGAVDTFFWHRETTATLTNASPTLLDAVVALTNQTRIHATFEPPFLLLRFDWDPQQPLCEILDGTPIAKLQRKTFAGHVLCNDQDWDSMLPTLKKGTGLAIAPKKHSRYSYHFYRSTFAAWNLNSWEAVEAMALSTRTIVSVGRRTLSF